MTTPLTSEQEQEIRTAHVSIGDYGTTPGGVSQLCCSCHRWLPCPTVRLLATLDGTRAQLTNVTEQAVVIAAELRETVRQLERLEAVASAVRAERELHRLAMATGGRGPSWMEDFDRYFKARSRTDAALAALSDTAPDTQS